VSGGCGTVPAIYSYFFSRMVIFCGNSVVASKIINMFIFRLTAEYNYTFAIKRFSAVGWL